MAARTEVCGLQLVIGSGDGAECLGVLLFWVTVGQGPAVLAAGAGLEG